MGHIEYASPECLNLRDLVTYDLAGDELAAFVALLRSGSLSRFRSSRTTSTITPGRPFGCHENYLMKREAQFTPPILGTLLSFLATRQIFTGAGRVGQANPLAFDFEPPRAEARVQFQFSQRADHIVNDIYQWVQFNRAIINARDEPLADYRKYRRLHLLIGDSNMSPFATALKVGHDRLRAGPARRRPFAAQSDLERCCAKHARYLARFERSRGSSTSRMAKPSGRSMCNGNSTISRRNISAARSAETDWLLESWNFTLESLERNQQALIGGVDWITKKWLLETFIEAENVDWNDPWLQSIDLEYHNIDPARGLFFSVTPGKRIGEWNNGVRRAEAMREPPANTRAAGRSLAVAHFQKDDRPYVINWDSIAFDSRDFLVMGDPFRDLHGRGSRFSSQQ